MFSAVAMPSRPIAIDETPLTFEVRNLGDSSTRVLALSNPSNNATVAYKLRTTEPTLFRVRQGEGVLRPGEEVGVRITIKPLRSLEFEAVPKFQVLSVGLDPREVQQSKSIKVEWDAVPSPLLHRVVLPCHFPFLTCPSSEDEEAESGEEEVDCGTRAEWGSAPTSVARSAVAAASNGTDGTGAAAGVKRVKDSPVKSPINRGAVSSNQVEGRGRGGTPTGRGRRGRATSESQAEEDRPAPVRESGGAAGRGDATAAQRSGASKAKGPSKAHGPVSISLEDLMSIRDQALQEGQAVREGTREIETVSAVRLPVPPPPENEHYKYTAMRSDIAAYRAKGRTESLRFGALGEHPTAFAPVEVASRGAEKGDAEARGQGEEVAAAVRGKEKEESRTQEARGREEGRQGGRRQEPMPAQGTEQPTKPQPCRALPVGPVGGEKEEREMVAMIKAELCRSAEWRNWARHARALESSTGSEKGKGSGRQRARSASPFRRASTTAPLPPPPPFLHPLTAPSLPPTRSGVTVSSITMATISPPLSADPDEDDLPSPPSPPLPPSTTRTCPTPSPPPRPRSYQPPATAAVNLEDSGEDQARSGPPVEEMGQSAASDSLNVSDIMRDADLSEVIKADGQGLWDSLKAVADGLTQAKDKATQEKGKANVGGKGNPATQGGSSKEEGNKRWALQNTRTETGTVGKGLGESRGSARGSLGDSKGEGESFLGSFGESLPGGGRWNARREEEARAVMRRQLTTVAAAARGLARGQAGLRDAVVEGFNALGGEVVTFASVLHRLCLRSLTTGAGDTAHRGEGTQEGARGQVRVQDVLSVCCVTGAGGDGAVRRVGDREVEVREGGKARRMGFDAVVECEPQGPGPCALFDLDGVGEEVEEQVLLTVQEGGVMCVVGEGRGRERVGAHALRRTVEAILDAVGPTKGVGFSVTSLEVDGPSGRVVDVLGRPHSPAATPALYTLTWDPATGDAYVANALQVRLRGVSDARRLCGVISTQLHTPSSLDSYGHMALNRSTDYNVDDELSDDDPSIADSDASSPNVRQRRDTQLRRQDATSNDPCQHRYLLTLLSITLPSSRDKASSPTSPSTDSKSNPDSNAKTARIYFLDVLPARHAPIVGESTSAPSPVVSPRALERALHSRAAIRSPFQPWDIKSIAGGGTLLPLLAEALCPLSRLVVVAQVDLSAPTLGPMHVLRLAAKTTQRLTNPAGVVPDSLSSDDDSESHSVDPISHPPPHPPTPPDHRQPHPAAGRYPSTEADNGRRPSSPSRSPSLFIPRHASNPFASSSSSHHRPSSAGSHEALHSGHTSPAAVLRRKRAALAFGLTGSHASSAASTATSTNAPRRTYGSDRPAPQEASNYDGPCEWQLVAPSFAALDAVAVRRHRLKPWK